MALGMSIGGSDSFASSTSSLLAGSSFNPEQLSSLNALDYGAGNGTLLSESDLLAMGTPSPNSAVMETQQF